MSTPTPWHHRVPSEYTDSDMIRAMQAELSEWRNNTAIAHVTADRVPDRFTCADVIALMCFDSGDTDALCFRGFGEGGAGVFTSWNYSHDLTPHIETFTYRLNMLAAAIDRQRPPTVAVDVILRELGDQFAIVCESIGIMRAMKTRLRAWDDLNTGIQKCMRSARSLIVVLTNGDADAPAAIAMDIFLELRAIHRAVISKPPALAGV